MVTCLCIVHSALNVSSNISRSNPQRGVRVIFSPLLLTAQPGSHPSPVEIFALVFMTKDNLFSWLGDIDVLLGSSSNCNGNHLIDYVTGLITQDQSCVWIKRTLLAKTGCHSLNRFGSTLLYSHAIEAREPLQGCQSNISQFVLGEAAERWRSKRAVVQVSSAELLVISFHLFFLTWQQRAIDRSCF